MEVQSPHSLIHAFYWDSKYTSGGQSTSWIPAPVDSRSLTKNPPNPSIHLITQTHCLTHLLNAMHILESEMLYSCVMMGENLILTNNCSPWSLQLGAGSSSSSSNKQSLHHFHAAKLMCSLISLKGILCYPLCLCFCGCCCCCFLGW
jgi:hypothetical protein